MDPVFEAWLARAYTDGTKGDEAKFTKWNMEVAFHAGQQSSVEINKRLIPLKWRQTSMGSHDKVFVCDTKFGRYKVFPWASRWALEVRAKDCGSFDDEHAAMKAGDIFYEGEINSLFEQETTSVQAT